ncbi:MAG: hypothetical protein JRH20_21065 [Deltaproteobacteria bacterium]|nr:hypothetical protein [Deltaproteobacteria bacterium]
MSPIVLALIGGVIVLVLAKKLMSPSVNAEVARAKKSKDLLPLINVLANKKSSAQPDSFNHAIRQLWDDYEREMAAVLVKELAERHPEERITQYWLDQVQKVEPEVAEKMFEDSFIENYYRPEVAARCGSFG